MRYLFMFVLIVIGIVIWRIAHRRDRSVPIESQSEASPDRSGEAMVQCRVCGVYIPQGESLSDGLFHYCSELHRNQDGAQ
jgi:hypothetical protein